MALILVTGPWNSPACLIRDSAAAQWGDTIKTVHNKPQAHAADDHDRRGFSTLEQLHDDTRRLYLRLTNKHQAPATATKRPTPAARRKR